MNEYMEALYLALVETYLPRRLRTPEYRQGAVRMDAAHRALEAQLSLEQRTALGEFLEASTQLLSLEDRAMFQEAVLLGRWMAG